MTKDTKIEQYPNDQWLAVVNPSAGIGKCRHDWQLISKLLNQHQVNFYPVFTERSLHAIDLVVENIGKGFRKIIVVGGDGTMNEVVNGIFKQKEVATSEIITGMISVGTGNDWGRTYHIPPDYNKAIGTILKGNTMLQDAGLVTYQNTTETKKRYFVNMAGMGFDGLVAQKTNMDKLRGKGSPLSYLKHIISSLFSFKSSNTSIIIDNKSELKYNVFSLGVGLGKYNGGGMMQVPDAKPDNGIFDLTIIKNMSRLSVIASLKMLYNGNIGKHKKVVTLKGKHIKIDSKPSILLEADGESLGYSPVEFKIVPKCLKVIINYL